MFPEGTMVRISDKKAMDFFRSRITTIMSAFKTMSIQWVSYVRHINSLVGGFISAWR